MRGQKEKKQSPLTTSGGCQGIKYFFELQQEMGDESELKLIHWEEKQTAKQLEGERMWN